MKGPRTRPAEVPAAAYGRQEALRAAARLIEWAAAAPQGRPQDEYIHELRVRLRRARAVMRAFRRFYPTRADFERRVRPLRRLTKALGPMRDADVTAALFEEVLKGTPYPPRGIARLLTQHHIAQEARWARVKSALDTVRALRPHDLAPGPPAKGRKRPRPAGRHASRTLERRFGEVWALRRALESEDPLELHALRIEIKRLRYTIETFDRLLGPSGALWGERLKALQAILGLVNDHTVALVIVERKLKPARDPLEVASLQLVARILEGRRAAHIARFHAEWERAGPKRLRARIRAL